MESNYLTSKRQSAFRCAPSTETALLKIFNDLLCYLDESLFVMYMVLELFAAFDVIDCRTFEVLAKRIDLQSVVLLFIKKCFPNCLQIFETKTLIAETKTPVAYCCSD